mgnify:CR=1 FL=1
MILDEDMTQDLRKELKEEPPSKSSQGSSYSFILQFYLIILLLPEFFMVVLHDLIHSSRVHQDFVGGVQVSFLLAFPSAINSPYSARLQIITVYSPGINNIRLQCLELSNNMLQELIMENKGMEGYY